MIGSKAIAERLAASIGELEVSREICSWNASLLPVFNRRFEIYKTTPGRMIGRAVRDVSKCRQLPDAFMVGYNAPDAGKLHDFFPAGMDSLAVPILVVKKQHCNTDGQMPGCYSVI